MTKVIIAGGRDFNDYENLKDICNGVLCRLHETLCIEFVSGHAIGADKLGEKYAWEEWEVKSTIFKPDYDNNPPKLAPLHRNRKMAEYSKGGILIAFLGTATVPSERGGGSWQARGGTWNMINNAYAHEMTVHTFRYKS